MRLRGLLQRSMITWYVGSRNTNMQQVLLGLKPKDTCFHARSQAEEIIRDVEARMPSMAQTIRAEVQGQAEAWATQQVHEQVTSVEMQASAALERQRQHMLEQANFEVNARNMRIASLEEQNARLLEALGRQSPEAHMATMTQLARETPVEDVSGLTTPKSTVLRVAPNVEVTQIQQGCRTHGSLHLQVCRRQVRLETACPNSMKSLPGSWRKSEIFEIT